MRASVAAVVLAVAVGLVGGALVGRWTAPTCAEAREDYASTTREIRGQALVDLDQIDPEFVSRAAGVVDRRPDCFSTEEQDEIRRIDALLGTGSDG